MATIRTTCPACGEVDLTPQAVTLWWEDLRTGRYAFTCPNCDRDVTKKADAKIVRKLMGAGIQPSGPPQPQAELFDQDRPAPPPPFTIDDVIDWHFTLQDDEAIAAWLP